MNVQIVARGGYGDRNGVMHKEHSVVDFPDELAIKLIRHGIAVPARSGPKQKAVRRPKETASKGALTTKAFFPGEDD